MLQVSGGSELAQTSGTITANLAGEANVGGDLPGSLSGTITVTIVGVPEVELGLSADLNGSAAFRPAGEGGGR